VPFCLVTDQVAELESTIKRLESQLEEQSSEADNAISEWHGRSSELEKQLETLTKEKEELLNAERSGSTLAFEELRSEKDRLERELREKVEVLAAANEDLNHGAEVVHEWEGKSLKDVYGVQGAKIRRESLILTVAVSCHRSSRRT
jgi:chromosome segregation ATPase